LAKGISWTRFHKVLKISLSYEFAWFSVRQTLNMSYTTSATSGTRFYFPLYWRTKVNPGFQSHIHMWLDPVYTLTPNIKNKTNVKGLSLVQSRIHIMSYCHWTSINLYCLLNHNLTFFIKKKKCITSAHRQRISIQNIRLPESEFSIKKNDLKNNN
jgi:hypothetical protein